MPRTQQENGFTLIELLVVVAIIGILSAIALPAFLGQTDSARDAKAKSDVSNAYATLETYATEYDTYAATAPQLVALEGALGDALNLAVTGTRTTFRISADGRSGTTFVMERDATGRLTRACAPAGHGGCNAAGGW